MMRFFVNKMFFFPYVSLFFLNEEIFYQQNERFHLFSVQRDRKL